MDGAGESDGAADLSGHGFCDGGLVGTRLERGFLSGGIMRIAALRLVAAEVVSATARQRLDAGEVAAVRLYERPPPRDLSLASLDSLLA